MDFPDLDRCNNKNLYILAYRDITEMNLDADTGRLWITGAIGEAKIDSDKPEKPLKEFAFAIEEEYVTPVTEAITERSGRTVLFYNNVKREDDIDEEDPDGEKDDGEESEEEASDGRK